MKTAILLLLAAAHLHAASTTTWEMSSYQDFVRGRFRNIALSRDGRLTLAPRLDTFFASDQPAVWVLAAAPDGAIYAGTGHRGRVFRLDSNGRSSLFWTAGQPEIFALAIDSKGVVYAGASPDGKVYRIEPNGQAREFFDPASKYIWSLRFGPDGALYVGTGDRGRIFRVNPQGQGEVWYDTGQTHVTALAFDAQGRLLAGSEPNGILYRVLARDKAFVLFDANLPEIRTIVPAPDGSIYAAALGGGFAGRVGAPASTPGSIPGSGPAPSTTTSITVEAAAQSGAIDVNPKPDAAKSPPQTPVVTSAIAPVVDLSGVEKSAVYRIHPDNTVETLYSSREENIYDLIVSTEGVLLSTDVQGRVYRLAADRKPALLAQTSEGETVRLLPGAGGILAASGSAGKVFRLSSDPAPSGDYESPVHDAGAVARWGRLSWRTPAGASAQLAFRTRTGNSARPDRTWSDWSDPLNDPGSAQVASPNARYIQWKAEFLAGQKNAPALDGVTLYYLPQNTAPAVRSINVIAKWTQQAKAHSAAASNPGTSYSITVSDAGDAPASSAGTPAQLPSRSGMQQLQLTWQAEDPDNDRLVYAVHFRGEDEREWKLLRSNFGENTLTLDADVLADGRYFFQVTASDRLANPPAAAREAQLLSPPVLIDNTPPSVVVGAPRRSGAVVQVEVTASDRASAIRRCEYSLDASAWVLVEAADGVTDSLQEKFAVRLENVPAGEHLLVLRAWDSAGNVGLAKLLLH